MRDTLVAPPLVNISASSDLALSSVRACQRTVGECKMTISWGWRDPQLCKRTQVGVSICQKCLGISHVGAGTKHQMKTMWQSCLWLRLAFAARDLVEGCLPLSKNGFQKAQRNRPAETGLVHGASIVICLTKLCNRPNFRGIALQAGKKGKENEVGQYYFAQPIPVTWLQLSWQGRSSTSRHALGFFLFFLPVRWCFCEKLVLCGRPGPKYDRNQLLRTYGTCKDDGALLVLPPASILCWRSLPLQSCIVGNI